MNRRNFLRNASILAAGTIAADQLELIERLGWKRRFFSGWSPEETKRNIRLLGFHISSRTPDNLDPVLVKIMDGDTIIEMHRMIIGSGIRQFYHPNSAPRFSDDTKLKLVIEDRNGIAPMQYDYVTEEIAKDGSRLNTKFRTQLFHS